MSTYKTIFDPRRNDSELPGGRLFLEVESVEVAARRAAIGRLRRLIDFGGLDDLAAIRACEILAKLLPPA